MGEKKTREELVLKLMELGQVTHEKVRNEQIKEDVLVQLSDEICVIEKQLNVLEGNSVPTKEDMKCPKCSAEYKEGTVFCGTCGQNIKEYYETEVAICGVCHSIMKKEFNYCGICGSKKTL